VILGESEVAGGTAAVKRLRDRGSTAEFVEQRNVAIGELGARLADALEGTID